MPRSRLISFQLMRGLPLSTAMGLVLYSQVKLSTLNGTGACCTCEIAGWYKKDKVTILKHTFLSVLVNWVLFIQFIYSLRTILF
jgi:hypothetical protein